ncbi:toll-like receptor 13 [Protopterus annectens]|uniref:toll-like receptor 13 n=1 Tax=Protopterus annectens TaxID=7888 RepID=UPI001CFAD754|nr:toll-like receptor 13 [Protopterus annectens]
MESFATEKFSLIVLGILLLLSSFSIEQVTKKCEIFTAEYQKLTRGFRPWCNEFQKRDFKLYAICDNIKDIVRDLQEVPLKTDTICIRVHSKTVPPGAFSHLSHLIAIYLGGGFQVLPGAFKELQYLEVLWLENIDNHDISFRSNSFLGLESLKELRLSQIPFAGINCSILNSLHQLESLIFYKNNITKLSQVTSEISMLQRLKNLSIIANYISTIDENDCLFKTHFSSSEVNKYGNNISFLDISLNPLSIIKSNSLCDFPYLSVFRVDEALFPVHQLYQSGIQRIETLSMQKIQIYVKLKDIFELAFYFHVTELVMDKCYISEERPAGSIPLRLRRLNLSFNLIASLTWKLMNKLLYLQRLLVSNNRINFLEPCHNYTNLTFGLIDLDLASNYISIIRTKQFHCLGSLETLLLNNNIISIIEDSAFEGLDKLSLLNLENNNVAQLGMYSFLGLYNLKNLSLYYNIIQEINPWTFHDLHQLQEIKLSFNGDIFSINWLYDIKTHLQNMLIKTFVSSITLEANVFKLLPVLSTLEVDGKNIILDDCNAFPFTKIHSLQVWNNIHLMCLLPETSSALPYFMELESLSYGSVLSDKHHITALSSNRSYLKKLKYLHLQELNGVDESSELVYDNLFHGLTKLEYLYLINTDISYFTVNMFKDLSSLRMFVVNDQFIEELQEGLFNNLKNIEYVYFMDVGIKCNCRMSWVVEWMATNPQVHVTDFFKQKCIVGTSSFELLYFFNRQCPEKLEQIMFMSTFFVTLFIILTAMLYENVWWYLLYLRYTWMAMIKHGKHKQGRDKYEYDAFVSYSSYDDWWVVNQLLPNLEEKGPPYFSVCLHNRDFVAGKTIVDNIVNSINTSRWTLCLLTHNYLKSHWCFWEMKMATYSLINESRDFLLIVLLEKISLDELSYYHKLAKLLKKKTYLEWPEDVKDQQLFWARLRKTIADSD